jgi:methionyl-tRNA formyltransferase
MYKKLKLCFMGSPKFSVPSLKNLIDAGHDISVVITQEPKRANRGKRFIKQPVQEFSEKMGLKVLYGNQLKENINFLKSLDLDMIIVVAFGYILPKELLKIPKLGCINLHASLLPRWRGAAPIQRAIMAGDIKTGLTVMLMDEGLDTGKIISKVSIKIRSVHNNENLTNLLSIKGAKLLENSILNFANNLIKVISQPNLGITYANKIFREDEIIDWNRKAYEIINQIRALSPFPGAKCRINEETIKIIDAEVIDNNDELDNGSIIGNTIVIKCAENAIKVNVLQRPGKKIMSSKEVLNGWKVIKGQKMQIIN